MKSLHVGMFVCGVLVLHASAYRLKRDTQCESNGPDIDDCDINEVCLAAECVSPPCDPEWTCQPHNGNVQNVCVKPYMCDIPACYLCDSPPERVHNHLTCDTDADPNVCVCSTGWYHPSDDPCDPCDDIDECGNDTLCGEHADCINVPGSFLCACENGYSGNGWECEDIIGCGTPASKCDPVAICLDIADDYFCKCPDGYLGDGHRCYDIVECGTRLSDCHQHANCTDAFGMYECRCLPGFEGDGRQSCEDIKECERHLDDCDSHATCLDDCNGSYKCTCNDGYVGGGYMGDCHHHSSRSSRHGHGHGHGGRHGLFSGRVDISIENNVNYRHG